jgi:hypothetical protein
LAAIHFSGSVEREKMHRGGEERLSLVRRFVKPMVAWESLMDAVQ